MTNRSLRRYERDLKKSIRGFRQRRFAVAAFHQSLTPLLEEVPSPSYDDLVQALGPADQVAQALLSGSTPPPLSPGKKAALIAVPLALLCLIGAFCFAQWNKTEEGSPITDTSCYTDEYLTAHYIFQLQDDITHLGMAWDQPREFAAYLLIVNNTNQQPTTVTLRYSDHKDPHVFTVPAGSSVAFAVNDPCSTEHTIDFMTPDGSFAGSARVLLSEIPIEVPAS
jgi:hypothetical protein